MVFQIDAGDGIFGAMRIAVLIPVGLFPARLLIGEARILLAAAATPLVWQGTD